MRVKDRPEYKSKPKPVTVKPSDTVRQAIDLMAEHWIGSVIVINKDNTVAGIVTERDLMTRILHPKKNPEKIKVSSIMTKDVRMAHEDDLLADWLRIMSNERFRHLPVVDDNDKLVNMMSQGDFVSYTWPEVFDQLKETAKATIAPNYQIFYIALAVLGYTLLMAMFFEWI